MRRTAWDAASAGYGTGSRVEYLLVPRVFGLGGPLVAMVGTNIGAGQRDRAMRAAWIGAVMATGLTEMIGLGAAAVPYAWRSLFDTDPARLGAGARPGAQAVAHAGGAWSGLLAALPDLARWRTRRHAFFGIYMHMHVSAR